MATVTKMRVVIGGVINVGDFQNTKREVALEATLAPDDNLTIEHTKLAGQAAELLANEVRLVVERQMPRDWLQGEHSDYITERVQASPAFGFLSMVSPSTAAVLVNDMVTLYASDPEEYVDPDEPEDTEESDLPDDDETEAEVASV